MKHHLITVVTTVVAISAIQINSAAAAPSEADRQSICWDDPKGSRVDYVVEEERYIVWLFKKHRVDLNCLLKDPGKRLSELPDLAKQLYAKPASCPTEAAKVEDARAETVAFLLNPPSHFTIQAKTDRSKPPKNVKPEQFSSYYIRCRGFNPNTVAKPSDPAAPIKISETKLLGANVKLRKDQDSLQFNKNTDEYKLKAKGAEIALAGDNLKNEDRTTIFATVGLDFGRQALPFQDNIDPWRRIETQFIPYYRADRAQTRPTAGKSDIDRDIVGAIAFMHLPAPGNLWDSVFSMDGQFITDRANLKDTTNIWASTFKWQPQLGFKDLWDPTLPGGEHSFLGLMKYRIEASGVLRFGEAFDSSNDPRFNRASTFLYGGAEANVIFEGIKQTSLAPFKVSLHYHQLQGDNPNYNTVRLFWASLGYVVDKDGDLEITVRYDKGRDYQTFVEVDGYRAGLAYKF